MAMVSAVLMAMAQKGPNMKWLEKVHDFGAFSEDMGMVTCEFKVINTGNEPLVIYSARANCGCTTPKYNPDPVQPGDTLVISVAYDAKGRPGKFNKNVYVTTNVGNVSLDIVGTVMGASNTLKSRYPIEAGKMRLDTSILTFGTVPKGKSAWAYVKGYNVSTDSLHPSVFSKPEYVDIVFEPKAVGPGEQFVMSATAVSERCKDWGVVTDSIKLLPDPLMSVQPTALSTVMILKEDFCKLTPAQLAEAPKMSLDTELITLENISRKSKPITRELVITNNGNSPLHIRKVSSIDEAVKVVAEGNVVEKGKQSKVKVIVDPSKIGDDGLLNARIMLITDDPANSEKIVRVAGEVTK